ncbi:MAG: hypothetical protein WAL24_02245 [Nitrososphaeraceae archaeon]
MKLNLLRPLRIQREYNLVSTHIKDMINLGIDMINIVNRNYQYAAGDSALAGRATEEWLLS